MKEILFVLTIAETVCQAQDASWKFLDEGHSNWVGVLEFFTTADRIKFIGPLDQPCYANDCEAQKGGVIRLVVDSTNHLVELRVDPSPQPYFCPDWWHPVSSMAVEFGPLITGDWVFWSSAYQFTNSFTVYPDPARAQLRTTLESGRVLVQWPTVAYRHDELETSADLTHWQPAQVDYSLDGLVMRATIQPEIKYRFFRLKRSPITRMITSYYPTGCIGP